MLDTLRSRVRACAAAAAIALVGVGVAVPAAAYPGEDDIAAARAAVADQAASVTELDAAMVALEQALEAAEIEAAVAAEDYVEAQDANIAAQRRLFAAQGRAADADASLVRARGELGAIAMQDYRAGGGLGTFEAIIKADGFDQAVTATEAVNRASVEADATVQRVFAAEIVARTMRDYAEMAARDAQEAEEAAGDALAIADAAQAEAESALAEVASTRDAALARLAQLRNVSVELERQRQAGLEADRRAREQAQWESEQASSGGSSSGGSTNGGSSGGSSSGGSSSGGSSSGGSSSGGSSGGDSGSSGGDAGSSGGDSGSSGGDTGSSGGEQTGSWRSSASQGNTAVAHALTLMGSPYQLGGNGPAYDCSGLTYAAWRTAGITLPRSSRTQYTAVTHLPYSQLRPGDLIFWASNTSNSSTIYHVAIYIGNGMIAEASRPGVPAKTRPYNNWNTQNLMPYVGRP